jgi:hypothetical protein
MKRDMDLARQILMDIEGRKYTDQPFKVEIPDISEDKVSYHVKILSQVGLIEAENFSKQGRSRWRAVSLTWEGHDFLDAARSESHWKKAKDMIREKGSGLVFEVLKQTLVHIIKQQVFVA